MEYSELKQGKDFISASCASAALHKYVKSSSYSKVQFEDSGDGAAGLRCFDLWLNADASSSASHSQFKVKFIANCIRGEWLKITILKPKASNCIYYYQAHWFSGAVEKDICFRQLMT